MCAILGVIGKLPERAAVEAARDVLAHRGPDDAGLSFRPEENAALAHRRLSIIDLSPAGRQPFVSADGRYEIIFNGELYNYLELKEELKTRYPFSTETDTEVLLAAYALWGEKALHRLNGMFAFAIWDRKTQTLFCARDRLGVKPFFYTHQKDFFAFASEIKGLLALGVPAKQNDRTIFGYLRYGFYDHTDETFFDGVKQLPAGSALTLLNGKLTIRRYWDLASVPRPEIPRDEKAVRETFTDLLADAVRLELRSDVPVGVNLSSGLDSNSLLYFAERVTGRDIDAFSLCLPSPEYNECSLIESFLSPRERAKWHTALFTPEEVFSGAQKMMEIQDQPYGGIPTISYANLNASARSEGVTVLLEGQGVDEMLAGYRYYRLEAEKDALHAQGDGPAPSSFDYSQDLTPLTDRSILDPAFVKEGEKRPVSFAAPFDSHLLNAQYRDLTAAKLPRVLRFNDHASMAYGRELRVPFLDHRLVEFCFFLPPTYKIKGDSQKVLLREVMAEVIPGVVAAKQKKTFGAIQTEWLRAHHRREVYDILASPSFKTRPYWDHAALMRKVDAFYGGEGDNSFFLWQAVNLELWFRHFIDA